MMLTDIWLVQWYDTNNAGMGGVIGAYTTFKDAAKKLDSLARSLYVTTNNKTFFTDGEGIGWFIRRTVLHS